MSSLRFEQLVMPGADIGPENPLPDLMPFCNKKAGFRCEVPAEDGLNLNYGTVPGILPYKIQDGYDRNKKDKTLRVAVLENDRLKAVFLLEYGGRLWSLVYKPEGREILYNNPVFQPANLALRNAWFSGGVEWNIGMIGHSPFTCAPLHAEALEDDDGTPVLRLYEWERIRQVCYQMDFYLPEHSEFLYARMKITNCRDETVPMYWWSNIAVPERLDVRVVVPADQAFNHGYDHCIRRIDIPYVRGSDISYSTNCKNAVDFFFRVSEPRPWLATVGGDGKGLVQASTALLKGRKLFAWGMNAGGRHWQEYLSVPVLPYFEVQAGLARTQMECLPMPANARWEWLEAYGPVWADPKVVHGWQWHEAVTCVGNRLHERLSGQWMENELVRTGKSIAEKKGRPVSSGSGWAALENLRRKRAGQASLGSLMGFEESCLAQEQRPWAELLDKGQLPYSPPLAPPVSYMIQKEWKELLEAALDVGRGNHWHSWMHAGIMRFAAGDFAGAEEAWRESLALEPSPWAMRNLAVSRMAKGDFSGAADLLMEAHGMLPDEASILKELLDALVKAGRPLDALGLYEGLPRDLKDSGRIRLLHAQALLAAGRQEDCEAILEKPFEVFDIREGEFSLTDLWFRLQELKLAQKENTTVDEAIRNRVAESCFPPPWMDYR